MGCRMILSLAFGTHNLNELEGSNLWVLLNVMTTLKQNRLQCLQVRGWVRILAVTCNLPSTNTFLLYAQAKKVARSSLGTTEMLVPTMASSRM